MSLSRRLCFQPKHTHVPKPSGEPQEESRSVIPASADRKLHAWFSLGFLDPISQTMLSTNQLSGLSSLCSAFLKKINLYDEAGPERLNRLAPDDASVFNRTPLSCSSGATEVNLKKKSPWLKII